MNDEPIEIEDIGEAIREARPFRLAKAYRFLIAEDSLDFKPADVADPVPLGHQLLEAGGLDPRGDYSLSGILPSGDFEDVRLDEPFDLRAVGAERFIASRTDREFKLTLDDDQIRWGKAVLSGAVLYGLAKPAEGIGVFLRVPGGQDRLIESAELIDLAQPGVEHFITAPKPRPAFEILVNSRVKVVPDERVTFEQVVQLAFPGPHAPNVEFSMTYRHAASKPHAGELAAGGFVIVKQKGTVFNVTRTVQS
ncbi:multiubiquitin domain-containing protein [Aquidulcibacter paucihalophilus]|jgi:hypothetical protein|nr:multiubiquitin domain-containing protein [Aquidulcibacter paucihalophilus]